MHFYRNGREPQSAGLQQSSAIFKVKWSRLRPHCTQNVTKHMAKLMGYIINELGGISGKVAVCTSQPVAFNGYPSTCGHLTNLRNKPQQKHSSQLWQWCSGNYSS